jgi:arsenate reductase
MAEGLMNHDFAGRIEAFSAGTAPLVLDHRAVQVMAEPGSDISRHRPEPVDKDAGRQFDDVMTLCGAVNETCPHFVGGVRRSHIGFDDPPQATGSEPEVLTVCRRVLDEIRQQLGD